MKKSSLLVTLLILASAFLFVPLAANAGTPTILNGVYNSGTGTSLTVSQGSFNVPSGSYLLVSIAVNTCGSFSVSTVTDTFSTPYASVGSNTCSGYQLVSWGGKTTGSGTGDVVTVTMSGSTFIAVLFEVYSNWPSTTTSSTCGYTYTLQGGVTGSVQCSASLSWTASTYVIVGVQFMDTCNSITVGASYAVASDSCSVDAVTTEYSSTVSSPSAVPWSYSSGGTPHAAELGLLFTQTPVTQPLKATFTSTYGGSQQTITISGCSPSPATFAGDGSAHSISMNPSCAFTLTLPAGYAFSTGGSGTTCASGTCTEVDSTYALNTVTQPVTCNGVGHLSNNSLPRVDVSKGGDNPTCDNVPHSQTVGFSQSVAVTNAAATKTQRAVFPDSTSKHAFQTWTFTSCASGTCTGVTNKSYSQFNITVSIGHQQVVNDIHKFNVKITATQLGLVNTVQNQNISFSSAPTNSYSFWVDWGKAYTITINVTSSGNGCPATADGNTFSCSWLGIGDPLLCTQNCAASGTTGNNAGPLDWLTSALSMLLNLIINDWLTYPILFLFFVILLAGVFALYEQGRRKQGGRA